MNNKNLNITKLEDTALENVSGGISENLRTCLGVGGIVLSGVSTAAQISCGVVGIIYKLKAKKAIRNGDNENATKYLEKSYKYDVAGLSLTAPTAAGYIALSIAERNPS